MVGGAMLFAEPVLVGEVDVVGVEKGLQLDGDVNGDDFVYGVEEGDGAVRCG